MSWHNWFAMNNSFLSLEQLWGNLLSREPALIRQTYANLDKQEQEAVLTHLRKMVKETGWHPEQRASAMAALEALGAFD
jgi:hypothetical protein